MTMNFMALGSETAGQTDFRSSQFELHPEWQTWVAECLVNHIDSAFVVQVLVQQGYSEPDVVAYLSEAASHPFILAGQRAGKQHKKLEWLLQIYQSTQSNSKFYNQIERRNTLTQDEFYEQYYCVNRPVILTGMMTDWAALKHWTLPYFQTNFGHLKVEAQRAIQQEENAPGEYPSHKTMLLMSEFLEKLDDPRELLYLTAYNNVANRKLFEQLLPDIKQFPSLLNPDMTGEHVSFWFGPKGTLSRLHIDNANGLLAQVKGRKRVKMFPSNCLPYMYHEKDFRSPVDINNVDTHHYPEFQHAHMLETILEPGEVLFNPIGWWHEVEALDTSISISMTNFKAHNEYPTFSSIYPAFDAVE